MDKLELLATVLPSFPHFARFAADERLSAIRFNSAQIIGADLEQELNILSALRVPLPVYFDVKGRQLRVAELHKNPDYLDITLNHPIRVKTPAWVLFKAGGDPALCLEVIEHGHRLIFKGGPRWKVKEGESLHIKDPSLRVFGKQFTELELGKIETVKNAGFKKYFLSYVQCQRDVDEFISLVGQDCEIMLKIENPKGLEYVAREFKKRENIRLVAARGDLYVEIEHAHRIIKALKLIIEKDAEACAGSRLILSIVPEPLPPCAKNCPLAEEYGLLDREIKDPSCADFCELAWLYDIGYRSMMLCDEICLKEDLLLTAVNIFDSFRQEYAQPAAPVKAKKPGIWSFLKEKIYNS